MATCKDCVHFAMCTNIRRYYFIDNTDERFYREGVERMCKDFADRSRFVELPDIGDYDTVTTIDEAIDHSYKIATSTDEHVCAECKAEHMRLCGWLGDLKRRIEKEIDSNEG